MAIFSSWEIKPIGANEVIYNNKIIIVSKLKSTWIATLAIGGTLISGCQFINEPSKLKELIPKFPNVEIKTTEQQTIKIACNKGNLDKYLSLGWKIVSSEEKEIPCTWKTKRAVRGCNIEKDKGCKITVPDEMGKETTYKLERIVKKEKKGILKKSR